MSSGPAALSVFRFNNNLRIPFELIVISGITGYLHLMFSGIIRKDPELCQYIADQDTRETTVKKLIEIVNLK